jgi:hypothetical protein
MKKYLALLLSLATSASAQLTVGTGNAQAGDIAATAPKVASLDNQWLVNGFSIKNAKTGETVLNWNNGGQVAHNGIAVSWSPDSKRVVLVDHSGKGVLIFGAELENGQWYETKLGNLDPQRPAKAWGVETVDLLNWLSPTTIQIREHYHVIVPVKGWEWQEHVTSLQFQGDSLTYAAN